MSPPDIPRLLRARKRAARLRELAAQHPEIANELDQAADDQDYVWHALKAALGRVQQLESSPGTTAVPMAPPTSSAVARIPSVVLSQEAGAREVVEAPSYTRLEPVERRKRIITSVEEIIRAEQIQPGEIRFETPAEAEQGEKTQMGTEYSVVKGKGA